ncbi:hypothetical protein GCM10023205_00890 [Yinghuangia aomiensis]|uniref:Uncharacterized protein n=1 Tax=Yinghuangia aomiensis TaxID=676205 RepID=A0ABP9GJL6_9ACTN
MGMRPIIGSGPDLARAAGDFAAGGFEAGDFEAGAAAAWAAGLVSAARPGSSAGATGAAGAFREAPAGTPARFLAALLPMPTLLLDCPITGIAHVYSPAQRRRASRGHALSTPTITSLCG